MSEESLLDDHQWRPIPTSFVWSRAIRFQAYTALVSLVDPVQAYFRRNSAESQALHLKRGRWFRGPNGWEAMVPNGTDPPQSWGHASNEHAATLHRQITEQAGDRRNVSERYGTLLEAAAQRLQRDGTAMMYTTEGDLRAQVLRFWNGQRVLVVAGGIGEGRRVVRLSRSVEWESHPLKEYLADSLWALGGPDAVLLSDR